MARAVCCAAKRSGAFPQNMPAGLRALVSRLGGFTKPLSWQILPPAGAPDLCHHGRSGYQPLPMFSTMNATLKPSGRSPKPL